MLNFDNFNVVTVSDASRKAMLLATMSSVLANVTGLNWTVYLSYPKGEVFEFSSLIKALAKQTGNSVTFDFVDQSFGVGQVKCSHFTDFSLPEYSWWLNIDDDHIVDYATLKAISEAGSIGIKKDYPIITFGVHDVLNTRNYDDWTEERKPLSSLLSVAATDGIRVLPYRLWEAPESIQLYRTDSIAAGGFMFNSKFLTPAIIDNMNNFPKGVRGYDAAFNLLGLPIYWLAGYGYHHIGVLDGFFNNLWQEKSSVCVTSDKRISHD